MSFTNLTDAIQLPRIIRVIPRNRNIEAWLLTFAIGLFAFELAQIQLSVLEVLRGDFWLYFLPFAAASIAIHIVLRIRASEADSLILPIGVVLNGLGIAEIYRLDIAAIANQQSEIFAEKQVIWTLVAMALAAAVILYVPNHLVLRPTR